MKCTRAAFRVLALLISAPLVLFPGQKISFSRVQELLRQAQEARQTNKKVLYLHYLTGAAKILPDQPQILYRLAGAHALNGDKKKALECLERLAGMGLIFPIENEGDLESLRDTDGWAGVATRFKRNGKPLMKAVPHFFLKDKSLISEGVAHDPATGSFFVSSVHRGKIVRCDDRGSAEDFSQPGDGLWAVLGLRVDPARRTLWATSAAIPQLEGYKSEDEGKAALFRYDLEKRTVSGRWPLPGNPEKHLLGDVTVDKQGVALATDSQTPAIYRLVPGQEKMEVFLADGSFQSLQGIDVSADQEKLFVADYAVGIYVIDRKTKSFDLIGCPENATLVGIDGLYFYEDSLLAVQNGLQPQRLVRIRLNHKYTQAESVEVLEANHPLFHEPTLGVLAGDALYFVGCSQWDRLDAKGRLAPQSQLQEPVIMKIPLK